MSNPISTLAERVLRDEIDPSSGSVRRARVSGPALVLVVLLLGALHGLCMSLYGLRWGTQYGAFHVAAVMLKVPALFLLSIAVTAPSLYVFGALARCSLDFAGTVRLHLASSALAVVVLASFAPIVAFFTFCTRSHAFMQVLNTLLFAVAGAISVRFLRRRLFEAFEVVEQKAAGGAVRVTGDGSKGTSFVLWSWFVIYALVGAQMGWILRPFIGTPHLPQELFRATNSNVFAGFFQALKYVD